MVVASFFLPRPWPGALVIIPTQLLGIGILVVAVLRSRGILPRAWVTMAVGMTLLGASLVPYAFGALTLAQLELTPIRLVGFGMTAVGLIQLTRAGDPEGDASGALDSLVLATAAGLVIWFGLVQPEVEAGRLHGWLDATYAVAYPSVDFALVALFVRLAWVRRRLEPYQWLIAACLAAATVTDVSLLHGYTAPGYQSGQIFDLGWLLLIPLAAAAALHPSARQQPLSPPARRWPKVPSMQLVAMAAALLVAPAILIVYALRHPGGLQEPIPGTLSAEVELALGMALMALLVPARLLVALRAREQAARINLELEERYVAIFEGTAEAILITAATTQRCLYANTAAARLFGYTRGELLRIGVGDLHPPAALTEILARLSETAEDAMSQGRAVPCLRADGSVFLADIRSSVTTVDGVRCNVAFFSDTTTLRALEARNQTLALAIDQVSDAVLVTDGATTIQYANPAFALLSGQAPAGLVRATPSILGTPQSRDTLEAMWQTLQDGRTWQADVVHRRSDGTERVAEAAVSPVHDDEGQPAGLVAVERDVTAERALRRERERLMRAIEQTTDAVLVTDLAGTIEYVNPAFERTSGYRREEAIGQNPRMLKSGRQAARFYEVMWRRLERGETWTGRLINRRAGGEIYHVEATISPILGDDGEVTGYVGVQRDVTMLLAARSDLANEYRERATVAAALSRLQPGKSAAATSAMICDELCALPRIDVAAIFVFSDPTHTTTLAAKGPRELPVAPGQPLPESRATYLYERATLGPWAEAWHARAEDGAYGQQMARLGFSAIAYAPIRDGEGLVGLLAAGTRDDKYADDFVSRLPMIGEFAATASALLAGQLEQGRQEAVVRKQIAAILAERAFCPVFQPVVELSSGRTVGYEALTRFDNGARPDDVFADAQSVGLGVELEVACLAAAIEAAAALESGVWLSLNASPEAILRADALPRLLTNPLRQVVVEITEHVEIRNYVAVRESLAALGPLVTLAVDDAGAGFASLRHVVELAPRFLKLDIGLVRGLHRDPIRQAMVAGLIHFATRTGCVVIAEGIEQAEDLRMLRELGAPLGQGYLLGRPAPLPPASHSRQRKSLAALSRSSSRRADKGAGNGAPQTGISTRQVVAPDGSRTAGLGPFVDR